MARYNADCLARSLAGHDKDKVYVVIAQKEEFCFLVNGTTKTLENPKKKKKMHLQPIIHLEEDLLEMMAKIETNQDVIRIINRYSKVNEGGRHV